MRPFQYAEPQTLSAAVALLTAAEAPDTRIIAGGSDLLDEVKEGIIAPSRVVSLAAVPGLAGIAATDAGGWSLGAMTTIAALADHPIPDFAGKTEAAAEARRIAVDNFDRLRQLELERIALAAIDPNRAEIDRVVTLMLVLPWDVGAENMLAEWRKMLSLEPGVNGGNKGVLAALAEQGIC